MLPRQVRKDLKRDGQAYLDYVAAQSPEELARLRAAHALELEAVQREAQAKSEERLRALRLRLYVSETRLRTLEDALVHHIEAAGPVLPPMSPPMLAATGRPQSPAEAHAAERRTEWT